MIPASGSAGVDSPLACGGFDPHEQLQPPPGAAGTEICAAGGAAGCEVDGNSLKGTGAEAALPDCCFTSAGFSFETFFSGGEAQPVRPSASAKPAAEAWIHFAFI